MLRRSALLLAEDGFEGEYTPYDPLGRGFLTGALRRPEDFAEDDYRRMSPRFQGENFARNLGLVDKVKALVAEIGCTAGQLALAWVLHQGDFIVPIPGSRKLERLDENNGALNIELTAEDLSCLLYTSPSPRDRTRSRMPSSA